VSGGDLFGPRPVVRVIDFEATGLGPDALICEVGHCDLDPVTREISRPVNYLCRVPEMPPETRAVHHIRAEETHRSPPYDRRVVYEEAMRAGVVAFAAHTCSFEERFMLGSLPIVCTHKAALRVWPDAPGHGVFALLYWLEDQGLVTYDRARAYPPHRALPDSYATAVVLSAIYEAGHTGKDLIKWTMEPRLLPRVPIGNWRGQPWANPDDGFLRWIIGKRGSDMDPDIIWNAERELDRRQEERNKPRDRLI
jgi:exodeoxyribonuclease X